MADFLLKEDGGHLLLENGSRFLLEDSTLSVLVTVIAGYSDYYFPQGTQYTEEYLTPLTPKSFYYNNEILGTGYIGSSYFGGMFVPEYK